jgi:hypothetical protein
MEFKNQRARASDHPRERMRTRLRYRNIIAVRLNVIDE